MIDIYGLGITQPVGEIAKFKLESIGKTCSFHTGINEHYLVSIRNKNHAAILLSFTGENVQIIRTAKILKTAGIPTIGLMHPDTTASRLCSVCLPLYDGQDVRAMEFMDPLYSMLFIIDLLSVYLHVREYEHNRQDALALLQEKENLAALEDEPADLFSRKAG